MSHFLLQTKRRNNGAAGTVAKFCDNTLSQAGDTLK